MVDDLSIKRIGKICAKGNTSVGDKVILVEESDVTRDGGLKLGEIYTVGEYKSKNCFALEGKDLVYHPTRFAHAPKEEPKTPESPYPKFK